MMLTCPMPASMKFQSIVTFIPPESTPLFKSTSANPKEDKVGSTGTKSTPSPPEEVELEPQQELLVINISPGSLMDAQVSVLCKVLSFSPSNRMGPLALKVDTFKLVRQLHLNNLLSASRQPLCNDNEVFRHYNASGISDVRKQTTFRKKSSFVRPIRKCFTTREQVKNTTYKASLIVAPQMSYTLHGQKNEWIWLFQPHQLLTGV